MALQPPVGKHRCSRWYLVRQERDVCALPGPTSRAAPHGLRGLLRALGSTGIFWLGIESTRNDRRQDRCYLFKHGTLRGRTGWGKQGNGRFQLPEKAVLPSHARRSHHTITLERHISKNPPPLPRCPKLPPGKEAALLLVVVTHRLRLYIALRDSPELLSVTPLEVGAPQINSTDLGSTSTNGPDRCALTGTRVGGDHTAPRRAARVLRSWALFAHSGVASGTLLLPSSLPVFS